MRRHASKPLPPIPNVEAIIKPIAETSGRRRGLVFVTRAAPTQIYHIARDASPLEITRGLRPAGIVVYPNAVAEFSDFLQHATPELYDRMPV